MPWVRPSSTRPFCGQTPGTVVTNAALRLHLTVEESAMPVFILWAVPAVFVLGGLTYVLVK